MFLLKSNFLKLAFDKGCLLESKKLTFTQFYSFGRKINSSAKTTRSSLADDDQLQEDEISDEEIHKEQEPTPKMKIKQKMRADTSIKDEHPVDHRMDPNSPDIDDKWLSELHLSQQHLPAKLLRKCQQVFSKFPQDGIRKSGVAYMKLYQMLHASEKPCNNIEVEPFVNTIEMTNSNDNLIYLGKKRRNLTKDEARDEINQMKKDKMNTKNKDVFEDMKENREKSADMGIEYDQNLAIAYLYRRMPHTFGVACRILVEIKYRLPNFQPKTFLDFGAGLGSCSYAFADLFQSYENIIAIEPSTPMRKLGKFLTTDLNQMMWFDTLARITNVHSSDGLFDIVYCGHVLEEQTSPLARKLIIETLWEKVRPDGLMILVSPGSPKGFRLTYDFRRWVLQKKRDEANIVAPCPHQKECPLADSKYLWCNFEQRISRYPKAVMGNMPHQKNYDDEKFSYIAVKKGSIIENYVEADTPAERSFFWSRIIRKSLKRGGHVIMDMCSHRGLLERFVSAKSHRGEDGHYKEARKMKWGDLWAHIDRVPNKFRKENVRGERLW